MAKKSSTSPTAPHKPIGRSTRRVRDVVQKAKCSAETKLILSAIQAAAEDIAELILQLPSERLIDVGAMVQHFGTTLMKLGDKVKKNVE